MDSMNDNKDGKDGNFDDSDNDEKLEIKNANEIKQWISLRLEQLEEKNQLLKEENKKVNEELLKLRERYVMKKSYTPEPQRRHHRRYHQQTTMNKYQQQQQNHPSNNRYYLKKQNFSTLSSSTSSSSTSSSSSSSSSSDDDDNILLSSGLSRRKTQQQQQQKMNKYRSKNHHRRQNRSTTTTKTTKKSSSLDRKLIKMNKWKKSTITTMNNNNDNNNNNNKQNHFNVVTLDHHNQKINSKNIDGHDYPQNVDVDDDIERKKPPTPPLHRLPSWESRIYEIAQNGIIQSTLSTPINYVTKFKQQQDFEKRNHQQHHHYINNNYHYNNNNNNENRQNSNENCYDSIRFVDDDVDETNLSTEAIISQRQKQQQQNQFQLQPKTNSSFDNDDIIMSREIIINNNNGSKNEIHPFQLPKTTATATTTFINRQQRQQQQHRSTVSNVTTSSGNETDSTMTPTIMAMATTNELLLLKSSSSSSTTTSTTTTTTATKPTLLRKNHHIFNDHSHETNSTTARATTLTTFDSDVGGGDEHHYHFLEDSFEKLKIATNLTPQQQQREREQQSLFGPLSSSTTLNDNKLEKSGYLYKLSGKFKVWKKRWFILKDGTFYYFKYKNDNGLDNNNNNNNDNTMTTKKIKKTKPKRTIVLDQNCSLIRSKDLRFHLSYQQGKRTIHLAADTNDSYNEWLRLIGQTLTMNNILKLQDNQVPIIENYLIKVRFGHSIKCWTALYNNHLVYFNNPFEKIPIGYTSLKDCDIQEIQIPDGDDNLLIYDDIIKKQIHYSLSIHPKNNNNDNNEPIYLVFISKQDFSLWYYHLKLAFDSNNIPKTAFENLLITLLNLESNCNSKEEFYSHDIWNNSLLTFTNDDNIQESLISLYDLDLKREALKLFRSIQLFIQVPIESNAIDYHITLIQNCLQVCLDHPELQAELYYQLIKQSSPINYQSSPFIVHRSQSTNNNNNQTKTFWCSPHSLFKCNNNDIRSPPEPIPKSPSSQKDSSLFLQCLQFLSATISLFLPQNQVLWLLKHHINRFKNESTELGKYFLYCERALGRTLMNGPRRRIPSRMEVLSIIQRNPYQHSMPHSIPVHFANNSYQVIGFDGSTTVAEFIRQINSESGIRDNIYSGFALYSDDPIEKDVEHLLDPSEKLADAISNWETTMRKYNLGKFEPTKIIKLTYKHRLCLRQHFKNETDKERLIWIYEINNEVINNRFPVTYDLAIELMSLMIQIEYGNHRNYDNNKNNNVDQILKQSTIRFLSEKFHNKNGLNEIVTQRWNELCDRSLLDCVRIYLNCTRKWNLCGCQLFQANIFNCLKYDDLASLYLYKFFRNHSMIWIAIDEDFIELLEYESFHSILKISYRNVLNYGYFKSYFTLTIDQNCLNELLSMETLKSDNQIFRQQMLNKNGHPLFFQLSEQKIIQITALISDYIEMKKQQQQQQLIIDSDYGHIN
ncbi:Pleckstrin y domaincontaining H member 2 [Dermatophagoides pteronyssinus]|uniref:Pleckstrin y domaincontaining H member 2 n=1 Tax=Dermatophagoides pteronyssinus TaxID=6956 RepID=A0ABQ8J225_DERPT|nr:Pleckstrin y domaincontaining H member 2 [Dermatophagoides pteronyssinus]